MRIDDHVDITAPIDHVWEIYTNVEHWPQWMESMDHVDVMDGERLRQGSEVWISQPRLPAATWTVVEFTPGRSWTWVSRTRGVVSTATHSLTAIDGGTTRVEMAIEFSGMLGGLLGRGLAGRARSYLAMEAAGLAEACAFHGTD